MTFERNLERWESGDMSTGELANAHPDEDVEGLLALHERMSAIAAEPVPLDEAALQGFLARLPDRARPRRRYRSVLLAAAAVLLMGSMAVAVPVVQHGVTGVAHGVGRFLGIDEPPPVQGAPPAASSSPPGRDEQPDHRDDSGGPSGPSDHPTGGHGADGNDGDEHDGTTATESGGDQGDQGQDQQGDGGSGGQSDEGSSGSSSGSGSGSGSDEQGDGSSGGDQGQSSADDTDGQS